MRYLLDTDIVSLFIRGYSENLLKKVDSFNLKDLAISVITYAEIVFGLKKKGSKILYDHVMSLVSKLPVIYIDENTAEEYAAIRLDNMDMMIAELQ